MSRYKYATPDRAALCRACGWVYTWTLRNRDCPACRKAIAAKRRAHRAAAVALALKPEPRAAFYPRDYWLEQDRLDAEHLAKHGIEVTP